ncbi:ABC transporter permease [Xanthobacter dioxanivorans]|uniref:ABC transporter permease n=1 Tax=Xanthobacter dioxanivorans TaxID=2528964 RepID=A0A974PMY7_9HYPH|nr:ABC transporter permease [Xanthobacter dioxanivorans]QRG05945.1 ABC transporter permease [Xanthobacter dioxanivorans]
MIDKLSSALKGAAAPLAGALSVLVLWEVVVRVLGVQPVFVPPPSLVLADIASAPLWFAQQTAFTAVITLAGFACAAVFGILFAVLIVEWPLLDRLLFPLFIALNSVPKVAVAPLFIIWFGTGAEPKIAISFLVAVFAIVVDTALGLRSVPADTLDLARALRGSRLKVLLRIKLYCALPHIFAGLKVTMSLALVGAIVGEFVSAQQGLGYVIMTAQGMFDTPRVFAAILILAVLGLGLIAVIDAVERRALPWRARAAAGGH